MILSMLKTVAVILTLHTSQKDTLPPIKQVQLVVMDDKPAKNNGTFYNGFYIERKLYVCTAKTSHGKYPTQGDSVLLNFLDSTITDRAGKYKITFVRQ